MSRRDAIHTSAIDAAWQRCASAAAVTRGLVPLPAVPGPPRHEDGSFQWQSDPLMDLPCATFYTDGSLLDGDLPGCTRLGWAFVAIDAAGQRIAAANGAPPPWIDSISGAEAWALLMAATYAAPGSSFKTDSLNCVDTMRRGRTWALAPSRPLARVWRRLFNTFDGPDDAAHIVWIPAHSTAADVGKRLTGDGTPLTAVDRNANADADAFAKAAAAAHRVPVALRAEISATIDAAHTVAQYIGRTTHAANHHPIPPHRDSAPLPMADRRHAPRPPPKQRVARCDRTNSPGGHSLFKRGPAWSCRTCWATTRTRSTLAPTLCPGPAATRWRTREYTLREAGHSDGPRHSRVMTDGIVWCTKCGQYAVSFAVGLAKPCPGAPSCDGTRACRNHLASFRHPRTRLPLCPPHFPEHRQAHAALFHLSVATPQSATPLYTTARWGSRNPDSHWAAHRPIPRARPHTLPAAHADPPPQLAAISDELSRGSTPSVASHAIIQEPRTLASPVQQMHRLRYRTKQPPREQLVVGNALASTASSVAPVSASAASNGVVHAPAAAATLAAVPADKHVQTKLPPAPESLVRQWRPPRCTDFDFGNRGKKRPLAECHRKELLQSLKRRCVGSTS